MRARRSLPLLLALVAMLGGPPPAHACTCLALRPEVIFEGQVTRMEHTHWFPPGADAARGRPVEEVYFSVLRSWKGQLGPEVAVRTNRTLDDACGYPFEMGRTYLVRASEGGFGAPILVTTDCSGTQPIEEAADDVVVLDRLRWIPPLLEWWIDPYRSHQLWRDGVFLGLGLLIILGGGMGYRLARRPGAISGA